MVVKPVSTPTIMLLSRVRDRPCCWLAMRDSVALATLMMLPSCRHTGVGGKASAQLAWLRGGRSEGWERQPGCRMRARRGL